MGGDSPLDGISIYGGGAYWHFVTYGLSELYEKESEDEEISGYGMEFTFKLRKENYADEEAELQCVCGILQSIARITFTQGEVFNAYEYVYTGRWILWNLLVLRMRNYWRFVVASLVWKTYIGNWAVI